MKEAGRNKKRDIRKKWKERKIQKEKKKENT